jgi:glutathione synthase/RimK-type ligase-like ATP-grasp enzyme
MVDKKRLDLLISTAESMGLRPKRVNNLGLISVEIEGKKRFLFHKVSNPNNPMASMLSENKFVTRIIFEQNDLPNIPYCLPVDQNEAKTFLAEHGKIIAKPVRGKHSEDIHLITQPSEIEELNISGYILEKFIKGQETRFLVVSGVVEAVHLKVYESDINNPDTVKRISLETDAWDDSLVRVATRAAEAIGLCFTAVDFLVTEDNGAYLLEINSAPGLDRFQTPDEGPPIDVMKLYLEQVVTNYTNM